MTEPPASPASDRLRDAYRAVVEAVQPNDIGDLPRARSRARHRPRSASPARWGRRLTPLAAAAAVVLAIGLAVAVPRLTGDGPAATATAPAPAGASGQPPFLVDIGGTSRIELEVRTAATGAVLARLSPPAGPGSWVLVAATGSPTRFVAGALYDHGRDFCSGQNYLQLYTLTLTAAGKPASLTPLYRIPADAIGSVPSGSRSAVSVSADGRTVAYVTLTPCGRQTSRTALSIVLVRDGVSRTWTTPLAAGASSPSLSADGRELGYADIGQYEWPISPLGSAWILPAGARPGPAAPRSRQLFANVPRAGIQLADEELSPDGTIMYIVTQTSPDDNPNKPTTDTLYAYDTATGARLRTLHVWDGIQGGPPSLTIAGHEALVWDMYTWVEEVNLTTGAARKLTQIPASRSGGPGFDLIAVAW
jgi:hypothetical protein